MSRLGPLYAAVAIFPLLAAGAILPYVALQYRRRGTLGAGDLALAGVFALYLVGLAFSVILPLRPVTPDFCAIFGTEPRLDPTLIVTEARLEYAGGGISALIRNADVQDVILNVLLFIPFGMLFRHLLRRGIALAVAAGLTLSLLIELTQLTGNWGFYPCSYRFFSTSDLITNTAGAAVGAIAAPLLQLIPAQARAAIPDIARPISPPRRLLAGLCNLALILALGFALLIASGLLLDVTRGQLFASQSFEAEALRIVALILTPGIGVMLLVPLAWEGRTPGEWAVLIEPDAAEGELLAPSRTAIAARFLTGPAPLIALASLGLAGTEAAWLLAAVWGGVLVVAVMRRKSSPEGVPLRAGMVLRDSR